MNREVFYIAGYDPRGYRYYYSLYKKNCKLQNEVNNLGLEVSKVDVTKKDKPFWNVTSKDGSDTKYNFLVWNDIVKDNWPENIFSILYDVFYSCKVYLLSGLIAKYAKASSKQMIAAFYPLIYIVISFLLIFCISFFVNRYLSFYIDEYFSSILSFILFFVLVQIIMKIGKKIGVFWLSRIYAFSAKWSNGNILDIDSRIDFFADMVFETIKSSKKDEVLLVSHSVGTILAVSVASRVIEKCRNENVDFSKFNLITLGECIPLISFQKNSHRFRNELKNLALADNFIWIDYTSKIDGACFPLLNPITASGIKIVKDHRPVLLSTRFFKLFDENEYKKIRRDWYKAHFLYLMAMQKKGEYDYFDITAGNNLLETKINQKGEN